MLFVNFMFTFNIIMFYSFFFGKQIAVEIWA